MLDTESWKSYGGCKEYREKWRKFGRHLIVLFETIGIKRP
jgi:hypothetical protein